MPVGIEHNALFCKVRPFANKVCSVSAPLRALAGSQNPRYVCRPATPTGPNAVALGPQQLSSVVTAAPSPQITKATARKGKTLKANPSFHGEQAAKCGLLTIRQGRSVLARQGFRLAPRACGAPLTRSGSGKARTKNKRPAAKEKTVLTKRVANTRERGQNACLGKNC
jgi:hypothetical protein